MKRIFCLVITFLVIGVASSWAQDSLGDYARKQREKQKPAAPNTKVWTNDDIASVAPAGTDTAQKSEEKAAKGKDAKDKKEGSAAEQNAQAAEAFKARVAEQKAKIADIERNLEVAQREYKLRSIDWYTNAGNALLDPKKWHDQEEKYQKEIADRQKQLADERAKLDQIRDEIRKAGLSSSLGD